MNNLNPFEIIDSRLSNIENILLDLKHSQKNTASLPEPDQWFDIDELCNYHPNKPTRKTVYDWVHDRLVPCHKDGKKLRFLKSEIDECLKQRKKKTIADTAIEAEEYLKKKGRLL
jgi:excisionase family DNA binding protein